MAVWKAEHLKAGQVLARHLFGELMRISADPPGVTRKAYGEGERRAHELVAAAAAGLSGIERNRDAAGNLFLTLAGEDRSRQILVASHLDTVPHGGNFDGAAGVVAGLCCQAIFRTAGRKPAFDLTVLALRAEESCWFPHSYLGSKTALGVLDPAVVDTVRRSDSGRTLAEHMREEGLDPEAVRRGATRIDRQRVVAYFEPHIEQASVLLEAEMSVGIVTGIRGSFRYRDARCLGMYAHSGATPRSQRRDAALAVSEFVVQMDALWQEYLEDSRDLTVTFGELMTDPAQHGFSKVAGEMRLCLDVRSLDGNLLDEVRERACALAAQIGARRDVRFEMGALSGSSPACMSEHLQALLADAARAVGVPCRSMASGAGHDAATFALAGVPSAMLFIRNENGSHNPDEALDMADFDQALSVLAETLAQPAERWGNSGGMAVASTQPAPARRSLKDTP